MCFHLLQFMFLEYIQGLQDVENVFYFILRYYSIDKEMYC